MHRALLQQDPLHFCQCRMETMQIVNAESSESGIIQIKDKLKFCMT